MKIMIDDYKVLENLSMRFNGNAVERQRKLNEIRQNQFKATSGNLSSMKIKELREKSKEKNQKEQFREKITLEDSVLKEIEQIRMIANEMNLILVQKIESLEHSRSFKEKEHQQEKIILQELETIQSKQCVEMLKMLSYDLHAPLSPILIHLDALLQNPQLDEIQKEHLRASKQNIILYLNNNLKNLDQIRLIIDKYNSGNI